MNTYTDAEIGRVIKRRVCARCYADLVQMPTENRTWKAVCPTCGDAWGGRTISRWTAERRGQRALAEALEVRVTLVDLFPSPHKGKSAEQILKEIGM